MRIGEAERLAEMLHMERELAEGGSIRVAGVDEAGRGPLAGPVGAAAAMMPFDAEPIPWVNDSKKVSEKRRESLYDIIAERALSFRVAFVDNNIIDNIGIVNATKSAMLEAVLGLDPSPKCLIIDAVTLDLPAGAQMEQRSFYKADAKCYCVAAASILVKVERDRLMREYAALYPEYGFERNKGYGTPEHIAALRKYGPCPIHRMSFIQRFL